MRRFVAFLAASLLALGCQSTAPRVHPDTVSSQDDALLGVVSELAGDWEMVDENGETILAAQFAVTSGGSAVREIMFPGTDYEMTNLYHMDGGSLVCTHYCAAGNQPRMVATAATKTDEGTVLHFNFESVTNLRASHDHYMGNLTVTILEDGSIRQDWRSYDRAGELTEPVVFSMTRKGD
jgi:hypothetical protein